VMMHLGDALVFGRRRGGFQSFKARSEVRHLEAPLGTAQRSG
jgi:hypothetical protein